MSNLHHTGSEKCVGKRLGCLTEYRANNPTRRVRSALLLADSSRAIERCGGALLTDDGGVVAGGMTPIAGKMREDAGRSL